MRRAGHLISLLQVRRGGNVFVRAEASEYGDRIFVERTRLVDVIRFLAGDPDSDLQVLVDLFGSDSGPPPSTSLPPGADVDRLAPARGDDPASARFFVHYLLKSARLGYRAELVVAVDDEDPTVPSLTRVFPAAESLERELFEAYGIVADGHPLLRPLLLYPGFVGHPMRKDYRASKEQPLVPLLDGGDESGFAVVVPTVVRTHALRALSPDREDR